MPPDIFGGIFEICGSLLKSFPDRAIHLFLDEVTPSVDLLFVLSLERRGLKCGDGSSNHDPDK